MRTLLALLILTVLATQASAKCKMQLHTVNGIVLDTAGAPVPNALVGASWTRQSLPAGPAMHLTDHEGKYSIPIWFDTYSGYSLLGDECDEALSQISIAAYTDSEYSLPVIVSVDNSDQISVPAIIVEQKIQREAIW